ncbi:MAG: hypothetical protein ACE5KM_21295 [Planctomycetaceae bacterium]
MRYHCLSRVVVVTLLMSASGCGEATIEFREVKRPHEKVTETELKQFLRIVNALPDKQLPPLPPVMRPLPNWNSDRTLPVRELVNEEQKLLDEGWDVDAIATRWKRNGGLQRLVEREGITLEQFVGLTLAIGAAVSRNTLRREQDLQDILNRGRSVVAQLQSDERTFARLSREAKYAVLRRAGWITRIDRAERLKDVPPENIALVGSHADRLKAVLPGYFLEDPFEAVADRLEESGMPFQELPETGRDEEITWGPEDRPIRPDLNAADGARSAGPMGTGPPAGDAGS